MYRQCWVWVAAREGAGWVMSWRDEHVDGLQYPAEESLGAEQVLWCVASETVVSCDVFAWGCFSEMDIEILYGRMTYIYDSGARQCARLNCLKC